MNEQLAYNIAAPTSVWIILDILDRLLQGELDLSFMRKQQEPLANRRTIYYDSSPLRPVALRDVLRDAAHVAECAGGLWVILLQNNSQFPLTVQRNYASLLVQRIYFFGVDKWKENS